MTETPITPDEMQVEQIFLEDYIEAGLLVVLSSETFMVAVLAALPFLTILIIVVDYFNRKGRR